MVVSCGQHTAPRREVIWVECQGTMNKLEKKADFAAAVNLDAPYAAAEGRMRIKVSFHPHYSELTSFAPVK